MKVKHSVIVLSVHICFFKSQLVWVFLLSFLHIYNKFDFNSSTRIKIEESHYFGH